MPPKDPLTNTASAGYSKPVGTETRRENRAASAGFSDPVGDNGERSSEASAGYSEPVGAEIRRTEKLRQAASRSRAARGSSDRILRYDRLCLDGGPF